MRTYTRTKISPCDLSLVFIEPQVHTYMLAFFVVSGFYLFFLTIYINVRILEKCSSDDFICMSTLVLSTSTLRTGFHELSWKLVALRTSRFFAMGSKRMEISFGKCEWASISMADMDNKSKLLPYVYRQQENVGVCVCVLCVLIQGGSKIFWSLSVRYLISVQNAKVNFDPSYAKRRVLASAKTKIIIRCCSVSSLSLRPMVCSLLPLSRLGARAV